jgi:putative ABC transport system permease protein
LAIGIAASTAIFSVVDTILIRPLPYGEPERLVVASVELRKRNTRELPLSGPDFLDLRSRARSTVEDFGAVLTARTLLAQTDGSLEQVRFAAASPNFFRLLRRPIALGRDFVDQDGQVLASEIDTGPGIPFVRRLSTVAILSHEYWLRRYGGDRGVLGTRLATSEGPGAEIVGILAPGTELAFPPRLGVERLPDVWLAARIPYDATQRAAFAYRVIGRLRHGASVDAARNEVAGIAAQFRGEFSLWQSADFRITVESLDQHLVAEIAPVLLTLMGATLVFLLIACVNVTNLLVVQASYREREFAVRSALGATRAQLIRQVIVEALLLSGVATVTSVFLAWGGVRALVAIAPADLPRVESVSFDAIALGFAALLGSLVAVAIAVAPALRGSRTNVLSLLRAEGRTLTIGSGHVLRIAVVAEVALSFVLVIGSGLMLRSVSELRRIDPGFEPQDLLTFQVLTPRQPTPGGREAQMRELRRRLSGLPGVVAATAASPFPLADPFNPIRWGTEESLADESKFQAADYQVLLPGYFEVLKTRVIAGRSFADADNTAERAVVIVDESLANKAFGAESAVGKRILVRIRTANPEWVEVIGIVAHQRASALTTPGREQIYFTDGFLGHGASGRWAIRTMSDPIAYEGAVRAVAGDLGRVVITEMRSMDALVARAGARTQFTFALILILAVMSLILALVGIYGVLSTHVRLRTAEVGARMALGAEPGRILALVLRQGLLLVGVGVAVGIFAALLVTKLMTTMLVAVEPTDIVTFATTTITYGVVATVACLIPARRAANLDPVAALRGD